MRGVVSMASRAKSRSGRGVAGSSCSGSILPETCALMKPKQVFLIIYSL